MLRCLKRYFPGKVCGGIKGIRFSDLSNQAVERRRMLYIIILAFPASVSLTLKNSFSRYHWPLAGLIGYQACFLIGGWKIATNMRENYIITEAYDKQIIHTWGNWEGAGLPGCRLASPQPSPPETSHTCSGAVGRSRLTTGWEPWVSLLWNNVEAQKLIRDVLCWNNHRPGKGKTGGLRINAIPVECLYPAGW